MPIYQYQIITSAGGREENQDFSQCAEINNGLVCALADGLGGHKGGRTASHLSVNTIMESIQQDFSFTPEGLQTLHKKAHQSVVSGQQQSEIKDMRSTLVLLILYQEQALWLHCGDSRLYHFRDGQIIAQTRDHSVPGLFVAAEEITFDEIRSHPDRNKVLRSLGGKDNENKAKVIKSPVHIKENDVFLLCSDGLWEYVIEEEMISMWHGELEHWLQAMEKLIIERAETGHDNYTGCAIQVCRHSMYD